MKNLLRKLPIEIYALVAPSILIFFGFLIWAINSVNQVTFVELFVKLNYMTAILANFELQTIFIFLWSLVGIYIIIYLIINLRNRVVKIPLAVSVIKSLMAVTIFSNVMSLTLGLSVTYLFYSVSGGRVLEFTLLIDKLERAIWGGLPALSLINFFSGTMVESIILYTYANLLLVFCPLIVMLAFLNKNIFRQTFIAFFLSCLIALPLFTVLPVISPDALYIAKVFKADNVYLPMPGDFKESKTFSSYKDFFHEIWISDDNSFYSVSSIPSLHAAWGLIILLGIFKIKKKILSAVFSIWFVFNTVGTFYSLQHYAIDTITGLVFGFAIFYLAGRLMDLETKYYKGEDWYCFFDFLGRFRVRHPTR